MKYHVIYKDDKFLGYTTSKKMLKQFLTVRKKNKYKIIVMTYDDLPERILHSDKFDLYALSYYQGYHLTNELPMFVYVFSKFESLMREEFIYGISCLQRLQRNIEYFKKLELPDSFNESMKNLHGICHDMITYSYHEPVYDEVFDVLSFFKRTFSEDRIN